MADKRKYVSQFEIQSNIDEALKKLQKYFVEMSKLPGTVEAFNKTLKKNTELEKQFFEMMSAIPKTMQKLSTLSKIELFPRKEMERLTNAIQLIESASKSLSGKGFDTAEVNALVKEFGNVVSELESMENRHESILDRSKAYNNLLAEASSLQKKMITDEDKFKASTLEMSENWTKVKRTLTTIENQLKTAPKEGVLSIPYMEKSAEKLDEIRRTIEDMDDTYERITKSTKQLSNNFKEILNSSRDTATSLQNSIAKTSFESVVSEISDLQEKFETISDNTEKSNSLMLGQLEDINSQLEERKNRLNEILSIESKLVAEQKTSNDAINLMNRISGEILEEMGDITNWNKAISRQFEAQVSKVNKLRDDLEEVVLNEKASNEEIRAKMGLLKLEGDKLRMIANRQEEIKKLENESISATVRRAKEQNEINKAYIKQTLEQKKNLGGVVDAFKVFKKGIPTKAMATFGETGVVAAKGMASAFKLLGAVLAPLAGLFSFVGILKTIMEVEKQIKTARKQVLAMAANTHTAGQAFDDVRKGTKELADSSIEHMRKQTEKWAWSLGVSMDQAIGYLNDFTKSGFRLTSSLRNLEDFMGIATTLGMEVNEVASTAGNLRAEFGMSLSDIGTSFVQMQKDAEKAGVTTTIFFDKVINAASGLGLYGRRIDEVSSMFAGLVKNMKLPEAAATSAAGKIIKSYKDLDAASQITIFRLGNGSKIWSDFFKKRMGESGAQIDALKKKEQSLESEISDLNKKGSNENEKAAKVAELNELRKQRDLVESQRRMLKNTDALKGYNAEMEKGLMLDAKEQFRMQMGFLLKEATGANITGPIEQVKKAIEGGVLNMKVIGSQFGFDPEVIESMRNLASNLANNSEGLKNAFGADDAKNLISILSSSENQQDRATKIAEELKKLQEKNVDLVKIQSILKKQFPNLATDLSKTFSSGTIPDELGKIISTLDVNFKALTDTQKQSVKEEQKRQAKRAGLEAMRQTKNLEDALNNTVSKLLRSIFTTLEKLTSMFSIAFKGNLGKTEKQFDTLTKNSEAIGQFGANIERQQSDLQYELEGLTSKEPGSLTDDDKKRVSEINKQLESLGASSDALRKFQENQDAQRQALESNGKISEELMKTGDMLAASLSKNSSGIKFASTRQYNVAEQGKVVQGGGPIYMGGFAKGGIVPGNSFTGDKVLAGLNSGELVIPENVWKGGGMGQTVNDNRTINIYVNQNDRRQVEQIVLNALYSDKLK